MKRNVLYFAVILFWLVSMAMLVYRHYGKKEAIKKSDDTFSELISSTSVPFSMKLPSEVHYLKVRLSGIAFHGLDLNGGRQRFNRGILEITAEDIASLPQKNAGRISDEYLKETPLIQSNSPEIAALSMEIVKDEKDVIKKARLIHEWVYRNIRKVSAITIPNALDVLRTKRGDCNEHATLFTALSRAAGIPARIALGLVYSNGSFHYHAWPEFFYGEWISVDPTLGQFPSDAAHIRLIFGDLDRQARILSIIGRIRIEGIEHR